MQISEAFLKIGDLCVAADAAPLNKHAGCWEYQVDERWWIAVNGHPEPTRNSDNFEVAPFTAVVKYNGWPAGVLDPSGGIIAAGECANEGAFIEALIAATKKLEH